MRVYYRERQIWSEGNGLWNILFGKAKGNGEDHGGPSLSVRLPCVIAFAGAGGKTSLIRSLAGEGREQGLKVLVTTTTHMFCPSQFGVFSKNIQDVKEMLRKFGIAVVGELASEDKIRFPGQVFYEEICPMADLVLVEADGSRRMPLKVPGPGEPVIPGNADMVLCVSGLSALGQPGERTALRLKQVIKLLNELKLEGCDGEVDGLWSVTPEILGLLMYHGYLAPLREMNPELPTIPVLNQADTQALATVGMAILEEIGEWQGLVTGWTNKDESRSLF